MGIALTIIGIILLFLFIYGRGGAKTTADVIITGQKAKAAAPVVAAKATAATVTAAKTTGHVTHVVASKTVDAGKTGSKVAKATAQATVQAGKSGWSKYRENLRQELADRRVEPTEANRRKRVEASKAVA